MLGPEFRHPNAHERDVLDRLIALPFPGQSEVASQLANCLVKSIDGNGSLSIQTFSPVVASTVKHRVPTEGEAEDTDGVTIHFLLHVVRGVTTELEIYKQDGSALTQIPSSAGIRVFAAN